MKSRADKIKAGKIYQVYPDIDPDSIMFEGSKTACMTYIRKTCGMWGYKRGKIRVGQLLWENGPKEYVG